LFFNYLRKCDLLPHNKKEFQKVPNYLPLIFSKHLITEYSSPCGRTTKYIGEKKEKEKKIFHNKLNLQP
jgi:hypothetical protein